MTIWEGKHLPCKACVEGKAEKPKIRVTDGYCKAHYRQIVLGEEPYSRKKSEKSVTGAPVLKKRKYKKRTSDARDEALSWPALKLKNLKDYEEGERIAAKATALTEVLMPGDRVFKFSTLTDLLKEKTENVKKAVQELEALI